MSINWLIQHTDRQEASVLKELESLKSLNYNYNVYGLIPFSNIITGLEELCFKNFFIIRGGTKIIELLYDSQVDLPKEILNRLKLGISYDHKNFDQAYYTNLNLPLLNDEPLIFDIANNLNLSFEEDKFIKPSTDMKAFNAGIIKKGTTIKDFIENSFYRENYIKENIIISDCKLILGEYRFICLKNKIIGASRYQENGRLVINNNIPELVIKKAQEYVKLYNPSDIFTMDLCETDFGIKIVEYNCWNCSGLYSIDLPEMFSIINDYYKKSKGF